MGTLRLSNGTTVTVPDDVTPDYVSQGLTVSDEAQVTKPKRRRGPRTPRTTAAGKPAQQQDTPPAAQPE